MRQAATLDMIQRIIDSVKPASVSTTKVRNHGPPQLTNLTRSLAGIPAETQDEIKKLEAALECLSPDTRRGQGSFFLPDG